MSDLGSPGLTSVAHNRHRIAGLFESFRVSTHVDQVFLPGVTRISDSSTSILTSNSYHKALAPLWLVPFALLLNRAFHLFSRRRPRWLPTCWDPRGAQPQSIPAICPTVGSRLCTPLLPRTATHPPLGRELPSIPSVTYKPPVVISSLLDDIGAERTMVREPSAVGTIIGGDAGLDFTTGLSEISLDGVSLGHPMMKTLAPGAGC